MPNYSKAGYARHKGVQRSRITKLLKEGRLITVYEAGETRIVDCAPNDEQFSRPAHNRGKKSEL